jgi:hypothetical protein
VARQFTIEATAVCPHLDISERQGDDADACDQGEQESGRQAHFKSCVGCNRKARGGGGRSTPKMVGVFRTVLASVTSAAELFSDVLGGLQNRAVEYALEQFDGRAGAGGFAAQLAADFLERLFDQEDVEQEANLALVLRE